MILEVISAADRNNESERTHQTFAIKSFSDKDFEASKDISSQDEAMFNSGA